MIAALRWQFDLAWALAEFHLDALAEDDMNVELTKNIAEIGQLRRIRYAQ